MNSKVLLSVGVLMVRGMSAAVQVALSWLVARLMGAEGVGNFYTVLMVVTLATFFCKRGMDVGLLKYLPGRITAATNVNSIVIGIVKDVARRGVWLLGAVMIYGIICHIFEIHKNLSNLIMMTAVIGMSINGVISEYIKVEGRVVASIIHQTLLVNLLVVLSLGLLLIAKYQGVALNPHITPETIWGAGWCLYVIVLFVKFKIKNLKTVPLSEIVDIRKMGDSILRVNLLGFLIGWMDIVLSNFFYDKVTMGVYAVANKLAMIGSFVVLSVVATFGAKMAHCNNLNDHVGAKGIYLEARKSTAYIGLPIILMMMIFSEWIMSVWGTPFGGGHGILQTLLLGQLVLILIGPANYMMLMINESNRLFFHYLLGIIVMVVVSFFLLSVNGKYAVAIGTTTGLIIINLKSHFYLKSINLA